MPAQLRRAIGLPGLLFYGVGTIVGGGIYALLGKVAGEAGAATPWSFLVAALLALPSACAYAELGMRMPYAAAETRYALAAFGSRRFATALGLLVVAAGVVSSATLSVATVGFVNDLVAIDRTAGLVAFVLLLGAVAAWGIGESIALIAAITLVEVGALVFAMASGARRLAETGVDLARLSPTAGGAEWSGILAGGFLAFYAFIGFEDIANVAEEVKRPRRTLPIAILSCLALSTLLYVGVASVAVLTIPPAELAQQATPLAAMVRAEGPIAVLALGLVSVVTGANGVLVQLIVGARILYGMASSELLPARLRDVHPRTQTPLLATSVMVAVVLALALAFPLTSLARGTSAIVLGVFACVNLSLVQLHRDASVPRVFPRWLPVAGVVGSLAALLFQLGVWLRG